MTYQVNCLVLIRLKLFPVSCKSDCVMCAFKELPLKGAMSRVVVTYLCKTEGHFKPSAVLGQCEPEAVLT